MPLSQKVLQWFEKHQYGTLLQHSLPVPLLFCSIVFLLWINRGIRSEKSLNLPPSPPKLPIIGHLLYLGKLPHRSFLALSEKYGPIMLLYFGPTPALIVSSAEICKQIMKTHDTIFANRPTSSASKAFVGGDLDVGFAPYGEYWREIRKIFVTDLLTAKRRESFKFVREEEIDKMVSIIKQSCSEGYDVTVNVSELVATVVRNFIPRIALGESWGRTAKYADLPKLVAENLGTITFEDVLPSLKWLDVLTGLDKRIKDVAKTVHQFLDEVIDDHLTSRKGDDEPRDFVDTLLAYQRDPTSAIELTRESLKTIVLDMYVGGIDMLNTSFEWVMTEVFNHPNVMKKLQKEIREVVGTKCKVDENDITRMDYLHCVIKETLRVHPTLALLIPRLSSASTTIEGYHIPAKTRVYINAWAISRDPKIWDRPEEFIPERFIDNPIDFKSQDFEFTPFGGGRRMCPAVSFATNSLEAVIANLFYWFNWKLPNDAKEMKLDTTEASGATLHKKYPVVLVPIAYAY
ncbi:Cytochrome p450 [Thalictrum thalictroides]|uniref:Cytochrome p450 n=1 Tax=Thalictrum thalictroides TaxID=46969 RepID=A0A7J6WCD7_THATH|nr:Cytochrome p450 [Thalictrum thalictroides]